MFPPAWSKHGRKWEEFLSLADVATAKHSCEMVQSEKAGARLTKKGWIVEDDEEKKNK